MFRTLSLRARILALPVVAAVGFVVTPGTTVVLGRRAQSELTAIRTGHSPALEQSRRLVALLERYQRARRDAVGASDTVAITAADTLIARFSAVNDSLARNATMDSAAVAKFAALFREYADQEKASSADGQETYTALNTALATQIEQEEVRIAEAFANADRLQHTTQLVTTGVLIVALAALGVLAWGTLTSIISAMRALSSTGRDIAQGKIDVRVAIQSKDITLKKQPL